jgi:hypothetical protein
MDRSAGPMQYLIAPHNEIDLVCIIKLKLLQWGMNIIKVTENKIVKIHFQESITNNIGFWGRKRVKTLIMKKGTRSKRNLPTKAPEQEGKEVTAYRI